MLAQVGGKIEAIFFCPHGPEDQCTCRKPQDGLFSELAQRLRITLTGVPAVGDSLRDLQAAQSVGATPILVRTGNGEKMLGKDIPEGVAIYNDLAAVVDALLDPTV
jgi:D-glycero-D-manno-heptose 1,7-bisphosphate phosphatase